MIGLISFDGLKRKKLLVIFFVANSNYRIIKMLKESFHNEIIFYLKKHNVFRNTFQVSFVAAPLDHMENVGDSTPTTMDIMTFSINAFIIDKISC